jgi:formate dehydrogenase subunit delta
MDEGKMVHLVNQIALFFQSYPQEEAVAGVADHVKRFWPVRMRQQLFDYVADGGEGLHALVPPAVLTLTPKTESPTHVTGLFGEA